MFLLHRGSGIAPDDLGAVVLPVPPPLATYNALFVPIFTMFGLLCLVMSALFRQATEMKVENDLTI